MAKGKAAKKTVRRARVASAAARSKLLAARVRELEAKLARSVPRTQLQSAVAKYRMAMARHNSRLHQVKALQTKICDLECRIGELERELAAAKTTST